MWRKELSGKGELRSWVGLLVPSDSDPHGTAVIGIDIVVGEHVEESGVRERAGMEGADAESAVGNGVEQACAGGVEAFGAEAHGVELWEAAQTWEAEAVTGSGDAGREQATIIPKVAARIEGVALVRLGENAEECV